MNSGSRLNIIIHFVYLVSQLANNFEKRIDHTSILSPPSSVPSITHD